MSLSAADGPARSGSSAADGLSDPSRRWTDRLRLVEDLSAAFRTEIARRDPAEAIAWPNLPDVGAMTHHVGSIHRWVAEILRTGEPGPDDLWSRPAEADRVDWFDEGRLMLLESLAAVPADRPCWIIGGRVETAAFWHRRMVYEHAKHLMDVRAAGGKRWEAVTALSPADYGDGIDELLSVFLPRSRPDLSPMPGDVELVAADTGRRWRILGDWTVGDAAGEPAAATVTAAVADLALALWERAEPLLEPTRFRMTGGRSTLDAFWATPIHPW